MIHAVCALILNDEEQVLSVTRKNNHEDYGLPGGKVEDGEKPKEALIRETREETGITVLDCYIAYSAYSQGKRCRTYHVTEWKGSIQSDEDGLVEWVDPEFLKEEQHSFHKYNRGLLKPWRFS